MNKTQIPKQRIPVRKFSGRMSVNGDNKFEFRRDVCPVSESTRNRCLPSSEDKKPEISRLDPAKIKALLNLADQLGLSDSPVPVSATSNPRQQARGLVFSKKLKPGNKPPLELAGPRLALTPQMPVPQTSRLQRLLKWVREKEQIHPLAVWSSVGFLIGSFVVLIAVILLLSKSWSATTVEECNGTAVRFGETTQD